MSQPKQPGDARLPSDGTRDKVRIHSGTRALISAFIERVFVVDYRMNAQRARNLSESPRPVTVEPA